MKNAGNTILLTGGGSGIGAALAHRLHDAGNKVIIAGRRREALEQTAAGRAGISVATFDVSDASDVAAFAARVVAEHPALNVLINNAGIMRSENIGAKRDLADAEAQVVSNLLGPIRLIDALVDHLGAQPGAAIVNVTSGLAFVPIIGAATYSATKAALHAYTVALREVLRGKVEVIELAPPGVQTDLTPGQATREGYQPLGEFIDEVFALLQQEPTPAEVLVERVKPLRFAEAQGNFDKVFAGLSAVSRKVYA